MKIEEVRTSFTVYLIASKVERYEGIAEALRLAGYMTVVFGDLSSAFSELPSNPPHILIFDAGETGFKLTKAVKQVVAQLPESHIFLLTELTEREKTVGLLEQGVYGLIYMPLVSQVELIQALDRAAERDYFMYTNERLFEQASAAESALAAAEAGGGGEANAEAAADDLDEKTPSVIADDEPEVSLDGTLTHFTSFGPATKVQSQAISGGFIRELFDQRTTDDVLDTYIEHAAKTLKTGVVFFKFMPNRRVLLAAKSSGTKIAIEGVGLDFNQISGEFRSAQLREPDRIQELNSMIEGVFETKEYFSHAVQALNEIQGVMVYLTAAPDGIQSETLKDWMHLLDRALSLQEAEKRLHVMTVKDPATDLLNRQNFASRVTQEISRSRRTLMPVSLALITVDQYGQIVSQLGPEEAQTLLRMAARIIEKHSRVTDVIGRTGGDEFGLILPHTNKKGALIKVERLRRIIESADFSRVLKEFPHVTISIGVSEYPSMVRDSEELLGSADEALYQVRGVGNKTCVSKPPEDFKPDFVINEKAP